MGQACLPSGRMDSLLPKFCKTEYKQQYHAAVMLHFIQQLQASRTITWFSPIRNKFGSAIPLCGIPKPNGPGLPAVRQDGLPE